MSEKGVSGKNFVKAPDQSKLRFGVALKLALGFTTVLLLLVFIALQSVGNYRQTQQTLDNLIGISDQMLHETTLVQTSLLVLVSEFKRIAEQTNASSVSDIITAGQLQKSQIIDSIDAVAAYIDGDQNVDFATGNGVRLLNESVEEIWRQMQLSSDIKLNQFQVEDEINVLRAGLYETETTLKPYFEDLFWEAIDDQQLIVLYEFYASFLIGLNIAKDVDRALVLPKLDEASMLYSDWQSTHLEYFLSMTSMVAQNSAFREASKFLDELTKQIDQLVAGDDSSDGLISQRRVHIELAMQTRSNVEQVDAIIPKTLAEVTALNDSASFYSQTIAADMQKNVQAAIGVLIVMSLVAVAAAIIISVLVLGSIRKPLSIVIEALQSLSGGDLRYRFARHSRDEFGELSRATESVNTKLTDMIGNIVNRSDSLNDISHGTTQRTQSALKQVARQADELGSIATSMQEMTYTVSEVANSASATQEEVLLVNKLSASAGQDMQTSQRGISDLRGHLESAVTVIGEMNSAVEDIEKILVVIRSIAEQTNLLALNAAIEAARAGEHGRGFAVVADEVRSLANRTQDSTSEIDGIIAGLNDAVNKAVAVIEEGSGMANESDAKFSSLMQILSELNGSIEKLGSSSDHIASIATDQSTTADEINRQVVAISDAAEDTKKEVEEVAKNITEVGHVSDNLRDMITFFKIENG